MFYQKYLFKAVYVALFTIGIFACSTHCASAHKIQKFFRDHSLQGQVIFKSNSNARRAYDVLLSFCGDDEKKIDNINSIQRLEGGLSGITIFKFFFENHWYVFRLFPLNYDKNKLQSEIAAQSLVETLGYAPKIFYNDISRCAVIMDFVSGAILRNYHGSVSDENLVIQCADVLRQIHSLNSEAKHDKVSHYTRNRMVQAADAWLEKLPQGAVINELKQNAVQLIDVVNSAFYKTSLTHNDFHDRNILIDCNYKVNIIDWEYAGYDNPLNDCAVFLYEYSPAHDQQDHFLNHYFGRDPSMHELAWLRLLGWLHRITVIARVINSMNDLFERFFSFDHDWINRDLQEDLYSYVRKVYYNQELLKDPEFLIPAVKAGIIEFKQYMSGKFHQDKELVRGR